MAAEFAIAQPAEWSEPDSIEEESLQSGFYIAAGVSYGLLDDKPSGQYEDTAGVDLRFGVRDEWVAFELQLEYAGEYDRESEGITEKAEDVFVFTVNLKGYLWDGPVQPYATVGIGAAVIAALILEYDDDYYDDYGDAESVEVDFQGRLGLGVEIPVGDHFYGYTQGSWVLGTGKFEKFSYFSWTSGVALVF